jgi:hypothetical protein
MGLPSASMSRVAGWFALEIGYALRATSLQTKFSVLGFQFSENNGQIAAGHAPRAYKTTFSVLGSQFSVLRGQRERSLRPQTVQPCEQPSCPSSAGTSRWSTEKREDVGPWSREVDAFLVPDGWQVPNPSGRMLLLSLLTIYLRGYPSPHISIFGNQQLTEIFPLDL